MSSSSFRLISAAISTLLLAALVTVIIVAVRDNPSTALPRLATSTAQPTQVAAATTVPVTIPEAGDTPAAATADTVRATDVPAAAVTPSPTRTAAATATVSDATSDITMTPDSTATATLDVVMPDASPTTGVVPASTAAPSATPTAAPDVEATAAPGITSPFARNNTPTVRIYSNGNFANAVAVMRSTIWAATNGGVVAWNKSSGGYVKFTVTDGLSTNRTVTTAVCPLPGLGVLFGSSLGIQIFDTQNGRWKTLDSSNSPMQHDDVSVLWCDAEDDLLVVGYTRHGLDIFDGETGEWTYIGTDEGLDVSGVRDLAVSGDRTTVWLATNEGLFAYANGDVRRYTTENSPLAVNRIDALALDGSGAVWLTSEDTLYRTRSDEWEEYNAADATGSFPNGRLIGLDVSPNGTIWLGSDQSQICRFDPGVKGCVSFFSGDDGMSTAPLTSLTIGSDGGVYYTTAGGGISIYEDDGWRQLRIETEAIPGNSIRDLTLDANGGVWAATLGGVGGIDPTGARDPQQYTPANSPLPSVDVHVVLPNDGGLWVGAAGVSYFDGTSWASYGPEDGLAGANVQAIAADSQNRIWIGTTNGLSIWTGSNFFNLTSANGLPSDDISALQADEDVMWIGTRGGGLLRFEDNQLQLFNANNSNLPSNAISTLTRSADGTIWIGTDAGLARFADNELDADESEGLVGETVTVLAASPDGEIWTATANNELFRFDGATWTPFEAAQRPGPQITSLLIDPAGDLWLGTADGGIARYTP